MNILSNKFALQSLFVACLAALGACSTTGLNQAPVVERSVGSATKPSPASTAPAVKPVAGTSQATAQMQPVATTTPAYTGKTYTIKRGDTLYSIALENGVSYRDISAWNGITNPNYIQADQVLRLSAAAADVIAQSPATTSTPAPAAAPVAVAVPIPAVTAPIPQAAPVPSPAPTAATGDVVWGWPAKGKIIENYTEGKNKGISIAGNAGEPIFAAADGKVVYAGSALKGYGQMLIIKHNDVFITAYAHNSALKVKEEQTVKRGQHIADMGNTESEGGKVKLHFEVRRNGKPQDPTRILPAN